MKDLPWSKGWPWSPRCRSRINRTENTRYFGRCELEPHPPTIEHTLERGMIYVRWYDAHVRYSAPNRKIKEN